MIERAFRLIKGGLPNSLLASGLTATAGLVSGIILARTLGPTARGEYAAVILVPGMVAFFAEFGLGFSFSYHAGRQPQTIGMLWLLAWMIGAGFGSVLAISMYFILPLFWTVSAEVHEGLRITLATVPLILLLGHQLQILLGSGFVIEHNISRTLIGIVYMAGVVLVAFLGVVTIQNYAIAYVTSFATAALVVTFFVWTRLHPQMQWQPVVIPSVVRYGMKSYFGSLAAQSNLRLDQFLMVHLTTATQLGFYVAAVSLSSLFQPLFMAISVVTVPRVIQSPSLSGAGRTIFNYIKLGFMVGVPIAITGIFVAPGLIHFLFGDEYLPSTQSAQILLFAALFQGSNLILGNGIRAMGFPGQVAIADFFGLLVTVVLLVFLLPSLGALGAAMTSVAAYMLVTLLLVVTLFRITKLRLADVAAP